MATQLFKDGEFIFVEAKSVQKHIAQGWSFDDPDFVAVEPVRIIPARVAPTVDPLTPKGPSPAQIAAQDEVVLRHVGAIEIPADLSEEEAEQLALQAMGVRTIEVGAMHVPI